MVERIATLDEIDRCWSLDDICKANALLDYQADAKYLAQEVKPQ